MMHSSSNRMDTLCRLVMLLRSSIAGHFLVVVFHGIGWLSPVPGSDPFVSSCTFLMRCSIFNALW